MKSNKSPALTSVCLMALAATFSGCATARPAIPDSLKAPCVSTVDVTTAQTVGDLGRAIVQGDGDLRVCSIQKDAVVAIAEAGRRPAWQFWR